MGIRGLGRSSVVALTLGALALGAVEPAGAQEDQSAAAPPPSQTVTAVADRVANAAAAVTALEERQQEVARQTAAVDAELTRLETQLGDTQRTSSALQEAARQQALSSYVGGDTARQSLALVSALSQDDVNDVVWSLGLLEVAHDHTLDLMRRAAAARGSANQDLTGALARRSALVPEAARLGPALDTARRDLQQAQTELAATVKKVGSTTADGMTTVAYDAYRRATDQVAVESPACGLRWELLGAIGKTESNHGGGHLAANGDSVTPIIGIPIGADTDTGTLDFDTSRDHAVGPMQFIPSTWQRWGADGDGDDDADPHNVFDETLAAGRYLCAAAGSLTLLTRDGVIRAILSYNPNQEYLRVVGARFEALASDVANGWFSTGDLAVPSAPAGDGADGGGPPSDLTTIPPATDLRTFAVFGPDGVIAQTSGEVVTAVCAAPSAVLGGRTGFVRCVPTAAAAPAPGGPSGVLDPCVASATDPTLVACVADPRQPVRLLRATTPQTPGATMPAPPYIALVLSGGDVCVPVAPPGSPEVPVDPAAPPSTTTTTVAPTTEPPTTEPPTTPPPTTAPPTTASTVAPSAPATYRCASGLSVLGPPDTSRATWEARVVQPGAPERLLAVTTAWA